MIVDKILHLYVLSMYYVCIMFIFLYLAVCMQYVVIYIEISIYIAYIFYCLIYICLTIQFNNNYIIQILRSERGVFLSPGRCRVIYGN
jgi:hypothetical protein